MPTSRHRKRIQTRDVLSDLGTTAQEQVERIKSEGLYSTELSETKILLGSPLAGDGLVAAPHGRSCLVVGGRGSGKTLSVVLPTVLRWPGPAVVVTAEQRTVDSITPWRARNGRILVWDPLDDRAARSYWTPFLRCRELGGASAVASAMVFGSKLWSTAGPAAEHPQPAGGEHDIELLSVLLYAAASEGLSLQRTLEWASSGSGVDVLEVLRRQQATEAAERLAGILQAAPERRIETFRRVMQLLAPLRDPKLRFFGQSSFQGRAAAIREMELDSIVRGADTAILLVPRAYRQLLRPFMRAMFDHLLGGAYEDTTLLVEEDLDAYDEPTAPARYPDRPLTVLGTSRRLDSGAGRWPLVLLTGAPDDAPEDWSLDLSPGLAAVLEPNREPLYLRRIPADRFLPFSAWMQGELPPSRRSQRRRPPGRRATPAGAARSRSSPPRPSLRRDPRALPGSARFTARPRQRPPARPVGTLLRWAQRVAAVPVVALIAILIWAIASRHSPPVPSAAAAPPKVLRAAVIKKRDLPGNWHRHDPGGFLGVFIGQISKCPPNDFSEIPASVAERSRPVGFSIPESGVANEGYLLNQTFSLSTDGAQSYFNQLRSSSTCSNLRLKAAPPLAGRPTLRLRVGTVAFTAYVAMVRVRDSITEVIDVEYAHPGHWALVDRLAAISARRLR